MYKNVWPISRWLFQPSASGEFQQSNGWQSNEKPNGGRSSDGQPDTDDEYEQYGNAGTNGYDESADELQSRWNDGRDATAATAIPSAIDAKSR